MYYVYVIKSIKSNNLYIGYTQDLRARLDEHNSGYSQATKPFIPYELIYYEAYKSKSDALVREKKLKYFKQGYFRLKERLKFSLSEQN